MHKNVFAPAGAKSAAFPLLPKNGVAVVPMAYPYDYGWDKENALLRARPNVAHDRIAYLGVSYGGSMGALFAAVEWRIKTAVLVVGNGGLVTHYTGPEDLSSMALLTCATRNAWFREMVPTEPIRFIGLAKPTPLLIQNGRFDTAVLPADALLLHDAAPEPRKLLWYDAGHNLNQKALFDAHDWLVEHIGLDPRL
jgi:uncharacterized protein